MSGNPTAAFIFAALLVLVGGVMAVFPGNPVLQVKDLGRRLGNVQSNTRALGAVLFLLGLLLIGLIRFVNR
jgi:flagellar motor component MotA